MTEDKAPTRILLTAFDRCHQAKFGVNAYPLGAKQAAILAGIWKVYGTERLLTLIGRFFEGNDFAEEAGYSVPVLASQVPRMLMQLERERINAEKVIRIDWRETCERLHGGRCGNATFHAAQMDVDKERAS